jgi:ferredoxin, 2Fe-2S
MHACGGKGRCTTCKAEILAGHHNLSGLTSAEHRYRDKGLLREGERLACQMLVNGDLVIRVPEETHLPHLRYDDSPDASDSKNSTS